MHFINLFVYLQFGLDKYGLKMVALTLFALQLSSIPNFQEKAMAKQKCHKM